LSSCTTGGFSRRAQLHEVSYLYEKLLEIINIWWQERNIPESWKDARTSPLFKEADRIKCENYWVN
jgi:hypothetical protein